MSQVQDEEKLQQQSKEEKRKDESEFNLTNDLMEYLRKKDEAKASATDNGDWNL